MMNVTTVNTSAPATVAWGETTTTYLDKQLQDTRFIVQKLIMPFILSFGVVGNMLNIAVLTRRWMKSSTNFYLTALAICDISYLTLALTLYSKEYFPGLASSCIYNKYFVLVGIPFANLFSNTGVWLTLTFTVERFIGVCHVMWGKVWCTPKRAKYIILVVALTSLLFTLPNFFENTSTVEKGQCKIVQREFAKHGSYALGYMWLNQTLFTFGPLILLSVFNILLINAVTSATKKRSSMTTGMIQTDRQERHMREQHKITVMLIAVVMVFLVCQLPQAISHLYKSFMEANNKYDHPTDVRVRIVGNVSNLLVTINSSINFVLYSSFSLKFRRTFRVLFCRCLWRNKPRTFIFSEVFSQAAEQRTGMTSRSKGTSSPYTSSPIRPATSYVSINGATPICSPSPSMANINKLNKNKNGYLSVYGDGMPECDISTCL